MIAFAFRPVPLFRAARFRHYLSMSTSSRAEMVLANPKFPPEWPYTEADFVRMDESRDAIFYEPPRLVRVLVTVLLLRMAIMDYNLTPVLLGQRQGLPH